MTVTDRVSPSPKGGGGSVPSKSATVHATSPLRATERWSSHVRPRLVGVIAGGSSFQRQLTYSLLVDRTAFREQAVRPQNRCRSGSSVSFVTETTAHSIVDGLPPRLGRDLTSSWPGAAAQPAGGSDTVVKQEQNERIECGVWPGD